MSIFDIIKRLTGINQEEVLIDVGLPEKPTPKFIMTNDGNITIAWNGRTHSIGKTHPNYNAIVACLTNNESDRLDPLLDIPASLEKRIEGVTVNQYGEVFYNGEQVHSVIADTISSFVRQQLPYKPLARFLANLMENPNERSRNELYDFLKHGNFPITHDGCFMAYKGLTSDFKDRHTQTFDNSIGSVNEMPREQVDPDTNAACSTGFHVGTHKYASDFASSDGKLVLVKVNPRDAVSVPRDHSCEKLRVCRYEVVDICERIMEEPLYVAVNVQPEEYQDDVPELDEDMGLDFGDCPLDEYDDVADAPKVAVKTPKRAACTYCGAKGGKKHAKNCKRPKKS